MKLKSIVLTSCIGVVAFLAPGFAGDLAIIAKNATVLVKEIMTKNEDLQSELAVALQTNLQAMAVLLKEFQATAVYDLSRERIAPFVASEKTYVAAF